MELTSGTLLERGKYLIISTLGRGGFGITYLAEQTMAKRRVCVKEFFPKDFFKRDEGADTISLLSQSHAGTMSRFKEKFIKEAQTIAALDHPNIIHILDVFEENNTAYYVMEYVEGGSLSDVVKRCGALDEAIAVTYIRHIADALDYIHEQKINHLDVKPGNIMVRTKDDNAILIDFGLAKHYDDGGDQTSSTPVGISHGYAPFEQYKAGGVSSFSPATDIYSLGATLYYLVTGEVPPSATDIGKDGIKTPDNLSPGVQRAIKEAMNYWREERPQSVKEFLKLLDDDDNMVVILDVADDDTPTEKPIIEPTHKLEPTPKSEPKPKNEPKPRNKRKSKKGMWLGIFLFVVVAVASFILFGGGSKESKQIDRTEQMRQDSIARALFMADSTAKAEREIFVRDSTAKVERELFVRDSTAMVERELFVRDSIAQVEREKSIQDSVNRANAEQKRLEEERKAEEQRKADEDAKARKAATLQLNNSSITHSYTAGDYELTFTLISPYPGMEVSFSESANWITKVKVGNQKLSYSVSANSATNKREATITLNYNGKNHNVKVTQNGKPEDKPKPVTQPEPSKKEDAKPEATKPVTQPNNEIWYTSSDGSIVEPKALGEVVFGAEIESNTYKDGKGILKFKDDVTTIGNYAFDRCSNLKSVTIPNSVTTIGEGAFLKCSSLTSITIPNSVTTIGEFAFQFCSNLTSVTIPNSVTTIEKHAFIYCSRIKEFNGKFASEDGRCLIVNGKLVAFAPAEIAEYTIPKSVTTIGEWAFGKCENLTSVTIPNSVTTIGDDAFYYCKSLKSVTIPDSVTTIGEWAFSDCGLTSVTIPDSVTTIGNYAFYGCNLSKETKTKIESINPNVEF